MEIKNYKNAYLCNVKNPNNYHLIKLDKNLLPMPELVLDKLGVRYDFTSSKKLTIFCPFHEHNHPRYASMFMDSDIGFFNCYVCGAKGGDIIDFYRAITKHSFQKTLKELGVIR